MWHSITVSVLLFLLVVALYLMNLVYKSKRDEALSRLHHLAEGHCGFTASLLTYKTYRAAALIFELINMAAVVAFFHSLSTFLK